MHGAEVSLRNFVRVKRVQEEQGEAGMSRRPGAISSTLAAPSAAVWPPEVDKACHVEFYVQPVIM